MVDNNAKEELLSLLSKYNPEFMMLRFTDLQGKERTITLPIHLLTDEFLTDGRMFDGSSVDGWKTIDNADMLLIPDIKTAVLDPFCQRPTISFLCNVIDPKTRQHYERCPRAIALKAEEYLRQTGIADKAFFGDEVEFFLFDDVRFGVHTNGVHYQIDDIEGAWNTKKHEENGNLGFRPLYKGGYCASLPQDHSQNLRSEMCLQLENMNIEVEAHHHEVATAGQNEISVKYNSLVKKADETQRYKYVVKNVAFQHNKSCCFMPKPITGDNGSGMHCNISLAKNGINIFHGDGYANLSETALFFIGGIIKHAKALNAFTNPSTNSYKRLVPGFEAPVLLAYSASNRSAAIRIPAVSNPKATRIEARFPDPVANPYLAFSALLMAGLDGILNKIHPGDAINTNLYHLNKEDLQQIPTVASSLQEALNALKDDHQFLTQGGVFSADLIDDYIAMKMKEVIKLNTTPHPVEFEMYYY